MIFRDLLHRRKITTKSKNELRKEESTSERNESEAILNARNDNQLLKKPVSKNISKSRSFKNLLSLKQPSKSKSGIKKSISCNTLPQLSLASPVTSAPKSNVNTPDIDATPVEQIVAGDISADHATKRISSTFVDFSMSDLISKYNHSYVDDPIPRTQPPAYDEQKSDYHVVDQTQQDSILLKPYRLTTSQFHTPKFNNSFEPATPRRKTGNSILIDDEMDTLSFEEDFSHSTTRQSIKYKSFIGKTMSLSSYGHSQLDSTVQSMNEHLTDVGSIMDANIQIFRQYSISRAPLKFISTSSPVKSSSKSPSASPLYPAEFSASSRLEPTLKNVHGSYSVQAEEADNCVTSKEVSFLEEDEDEEEQEASKTELQVGNLNTFTYNALNDSTEILNDNELDFTDDKIDMFRTELLHLVEKHKAIVQKQQDEIDHLKALLIQEKKYTSFLSASPKQPPTKAFSSRTNSPYTGVSDLSSTHDDESIASLFTSTRPRRLRRSGFIPINITVPKDGSLSDNESITDLLPPFRPSLSSSPLIPAESLASTNNSPLYLNQAADASGSLQAFDQISGSKRNQSISSYVSSVMSLTQANSTISSKDISTGVTTNQLVPEKLSLLKDYSPNFLKDNRNVPTTLDSTDNSFTLQFFGTNA